MRDVTAHVHTPRVSRPTHRHTCARAHQQQGERKCVYTCNCCSIRFVSAHLHGCTEGQAGREGLPRARLAQAVDCLPDIEPSLPAIAYGVSRYAVVVVGSFVLSVLFVSFLCPVLCCSENPDGRPTMEAVVTWLAKLHDTLCKRIPPVDHCVVNVCVECACLYSCFLRHSRK